MKKCVNLLLSSENHILGANVLECVSPKSQQNQATWAITETEMDSLKSTTLLNDTPIQITGFSIWGGVALASVLASGTSLDCITATNQSTES